MGKIATQWPSQSRALSSSNRRTTCRACASTRPAPGPTDPQGPPIAELSRSPARAGNPCSADWSSGTSR
jgi:hypothetical protein